MSEENVELDKDFCYFEVNDEITQQEADDIGQPGLIPPSSSSGTNSGIVSVIDASETTRPKRRSQLIDGPQLEQPTDCLDIALEEDIDEPADFNIGKEYIESNSHSDSDSNSDEGPTGPKRRSQLIENSDEEGMNVSPQLAQPTDFLEMALEENIDEPADFNIGILD